jgi:hypothetical protein
MVQIRILGSITSFYLQYDRQETHDSQNMASSGIFSLVEWRVVSIAAAHLTSTLMHIFALSHISSAQPHPTQRVGVLLRCRSCSPGTSYCKVVNTSIRVVTVTICVAAMQVGLWQTAAWCVVYCALHLPLASSRSPWLTAKVAVALVVAPSAAAAAAEFHQRRGFVRSLQDVPAGMSRLAR